MEKTFDFKDDFKDDGIICRTKISVKLKTYDNGSKFYYVNYVHTYIYPDGSQKKCEMSEDVVKPNPFSYYPDLKENFDGEIIAFNEMSEKIIKYLLLDNKELEKVCGNVTPECYRKGIMYNIAILSD